MTRARVGLLLLSVCVAVLSAEQPAPQQPAPPPAWNVTLAANRSADSTLSVVNQCQNRHEFQITPQNAPFVTIPQRQTQVNGKQTVVLPVQFNTQNLAPGTYRGQVLVVCLNCRNEATCKQDRDVLEIVLNVSAPTPPPTNPPTNPTNPPTNPTNPPANPTNPPTPAPTPRPADPAHVETPRTAAVFNEFAKGPCPPDCDDLKKKAEAAEQAAAAAQAEADAAKATADAAEKAAKDAEAAAAAAAKTAQPAPSSYGATVDGQEYSSADIAYLEKLRADNNAALAAGKISTAQHQDRAKALTAKLAREERLANEAKLKADAAAAKAAAGRARTSANDAKAKAAGPQKTAAAAAAAADSALAAYQKCLKTLADKCQRDAEVKAAADKKKADADARAAATRAEEDRKKKAAEDAKGAQVADQTYLLDNIKKLGLISSEPFKDIPGAFDSLIDKIIPDILGKTAQQWVSEMASTVADEVAGNPIPVGAIQAIGGLYQIAGALLDPCTQAGMRKTVERLQGMTNPKTNAKYTLDQALDKTDRMCKLLKELKAKVDAIKKLRGGKVPAPLAEQVPQPATPATTGVFALPGRRI